MTKYLNDAIAFQIYSRSELEMIADLCKKHNTIAIMDEVYEWMTYADEKHIRMGQWTVLCNIVVLIPVKY